MPSAAIFFLSSSEASSSSSRAIALACSATPLAAVPRPGPDVSVSWVCMPSPVDDLREDDPSHEGRPDDEEGARAATLLTLRAGAELRGGRSRRRAASGRQVRRRLALD